ncbi:hypothetical protein PDESU_00256 [Pontiella desulfatans]|uniref:Right handed beta helix domain-containing protein n=1 Tax=Pontiella desulfatans TaxID=2750659 RepID=A0A6C2TVM8_PONDE|nr:hypothetical protein [Pontiella desulfatans]VGO11710.1 hypothetical protein PDESU_00256 [Pontiella desulfatans]
MKKFILFLMLCTAGFAGVYYFMEREPVPEATTIAAPVPAPVEQKTPEPKPVPEPKPAPVTADFEIPAGYTLISSLDELADYAAQSGNLIRMKPGTYVVKKTYYADDPKIIFNFSGSNNTFDLTDVRIEIDTQVYADMPNSKNPHGYMGFRMHGDHITILGGEFEDIGEKVGPRGANEFEIMGNDFTMKGSSVTVRGSAPYGYGDMYGKGRGAFVRLQKHALMSVMGDRILIEDCDFKVFSYGHGIHMHGSQDNVFRNVKMLGALRLTDEIYNEKSGPAAEHDYKIMFPDWMQGQPIPKGQMLSLTEDGIRAYVRGTNKEGVERNTGHVTMENCTIVRMRTCVALAAASSADVTDCTVREAGGTAYGLPSNCTIRRCKGDASYSPLLSIPYSNRRNADIELELVETDQDAGDHALANIVGSNHRITITYSGKTRPKKLREICIGSTGERYREDNTDEKELREKNNANGITLINETPHPVFLTEFSSNCEVITHSSVKDRGDDNKKKKTASR